MSHKSLDAVLQDEDSRIDGIQDEFFIGSDGKRFTFTNGDFYRCSFQNCRLSDSDFSRSFFTECSFTGCDFTGTRMEHCSFIRSNFKDCRLMGTIFVECLLKQVLYTDCKGRYSNFGRSKWKQSSVKQSNFTESNFMEAQFEGFYNSNVCFRQANFMHALLKDVDFSTSEIEGCLFAPEDLKGLTVNTWQAVGLMGLFGVKVTEL